MKKNLFFLCLLAAVCVSCGQDDAVSESENTCNVNFKVTGFQLSEEEFSSTRSTAQEANANNISFAVFDDSGTRVADVKQNADTDGLGTFSLSMKSGTYSYVAVAHGGTKDYGNATIESLTKVTLPSANIQETFSKVGQFTVGDANSQNQEIEIDRVSSYFSIFPTTARPSEAKTLKVYLGDVSKDAYKSISFDPATGVVANMGVDGYYVQTKDISNKTFPNGNVSFNLLLGGQTTTLPVRIDVLDKDGAVLFTHNLEDVSFSQNRKTIATGSLFDTSFSKTLNFNIEWGEEINITF